MTSLRSPLPFALLLAALLAAPRMAPAADDETYTLVPFEKAFSSEWSRAEGWNDGKAEISTYSADRPEGAKHRPYDMIRIIVPGKFRMDRFVEAGPASAGAPAVPAFKMLTMEPVPTDVFPYQFESVLFVDRDLPWRALKADYSTQDWRGTSFKELTWEREGGRLRAFSHRADQGRNEWTIPSAGRVIMADQLPLVLRAATFKPGRMVQAQVLSTLMDDTASTPVLQSARIKRIKPETAVTAAGRGWEPDELRVFRVETDDGGVSEFVYLKKPPYVLLRYTLADGRTGLLRNFERKNYKE